MDGIGKEIEEYLDKLGLIGEQAIKTAKAQIDEEAEKVFQEIKDNTPIEHGGLKDSLRKNKVTKLHWYGYELSFEGENSKGVPYQRIANVLNFGTSTIRPRRFVTNAVRRLKNMDERIEQRIRKGIEGGE